MAEAGKSSEKSEKGKKGGCPQPKNVKNHQSESGGMKQKLHLRLKKPVVFEHAQKYTIITRCIGLCPSVTD